MTCERCDDRGWIVDVETNTAARCDCRDGLVRASRLEASGIPSRWRRRRLSDGPPRKPMALQQEAWAEVSSWAEGPDGGLLLWGPPGGGKTYLLTAALLSIWERTGDSILFASQHSILDKSYDRWEEDGASLAEQLRPYLRSRYLALDELGEARPTEHCHSVMRAVLEARERSGKPLLAASNKSPEELEERIGPAATSRLLGLCRPIHVVGRDLRRPES